MEEQRNEYRTGPTAPQQKHSGIITFLLILVIFLCGIISLLGFLNVRLLTLLDRGNESAHMSFSHQEADAPTAAGATVSFSGMTIVEVSAAYQTVNELPAGLYVSYIQKDSAAARAGVQAGDVILDFAQTPVSTLEQLQAQLENAQGTVSITLCRDGHHSNITLEVTKP